MFNLAGVQVIKVRPQGGMSIGCEQKHKDLNMI